MERKYTTLLFDLDGTLLDFLRDEHDAILKVMEKYGIECSEENVKIYSDINLSLWKEFEKGSITREELQKRRFLRFFELFGVKGNFDFREINREYLLFLSEGGNLYDGAKELLIRLRAEGYHLCAVTNGIALAQNNRLKRAGIDNLFEHIFISESIGCQKPMKEYFEVVLDRIDEKDRTKVIVIGDSLSSDIKGAENAGLDSLWYNPAVQPLPEGTKVTATVKSYEDILAFLEKK